MEVKKSGRPLNDASRGRKLPYRSTLYTDTRAFLKALGDGELSEGIERAAEFCRQHGVKPARKRKS